MNDRPPMEEPVTALERSLRDGPPDERGYRAEAIDFSAEAPEPSKVRLRDSRRSVGLVGRSGSMSPVFSFATFVAILFVLVVGGYGVFQRINQAGAGPSALPSSLESASPVLVPPLTETFVSTRNGFSVRYPAGWSTRAATTSWRPNSYLPIGNSALDELKRAREARLVAASQRLAPGQTEAQWLASFLQPYDRGACVHDRSTWPRVTVDGESGYLDIEACPLPADTNFSAPDIEFHVIVFSGGRVYEIALDGVVDRGYLEAMLATIRLDPGNALDPPASP